METAQLESQIKAIARESGAALVGIASRERLYGAPPSADPDYLLPPTRSIISFVLPLDRKLIRKYLTKEDWHSHGAYYKLTYKRIFTIADRLADFLKNEGFEACAVDANVDYRPEPKAKDWTELVDLIPSFSHRYGAVAAGLGQLGWSGNVVTPEFGGAVRLGSVLTSAVLKPDPLLEQNPCDRCKMCTASCPVEQMSKKATVTVTVAGIEHTIARKGPNTRCWIGCADYHGLSPDRKWSTWSPYRVDYPLPEDKTEVDDLCIRVRQADPETHLPEMVVTSFRQLMCDPDYAFHPTCCNCSLVCWEKREDREENQRLLANSGIVVLTTEGERVATHDEVIEVDTPYAVRVALSKKEYQALVASKKPASAESKRGHTPKDREVLSSILKMTTKA